MDRPNWSPSFEFFVGLHHPFDAHRFERCMISLNALRGRKSDFYPRQWILDSAAFTEISKHGKHRTTVDEHADLIKRWRRCGFLCAAVCQDWMCEPFILNITGLSVEEHQRRTTANYVALRDRIQATYIMPVLQGYWPDEYVAHIDHYGDSLQSAAWCGVGSVCKRNARIEDIEHVLMAIKTHRPDLRLHGFGLKQTALRSSIVRDCLASSDSMAWSLAARNEGRDGNDPTEAERYVETIRTQAIMQRIFQPRLFLGV